MTRREIPVVVALVRAELDRIDRTERIAIAALAETRSDGRTDARLALLCTTLHSYYGEQNEPGSPGRQVWSASPVPPGSGQSAADVQARAQKCCDPNRKHLPGASQVEAPVGEHASVQMPPAHGEVPHRGVTQRADAHWPASWHAPYVVTLPVGRHWRGSVVAQA
jgi:hypothetical protein